MQNINDFEGKSKIISLHYTTVLYLTYNVRKRYGLKPKKIELKLSDTPWWRFAKHKRLLYRAKHLETHIPSNPAQNLKLSVPT